MSEEIKEINIPENVLVALGDLTNGALNYYKAIESVKVRHNTILDYITNLQEENKELLERFSNKIEEVSDLIKENEKLKLARDTKCASEILCECLNNVYKSRNEKAIEYIKSFGGEWKNYSLYYNEIMNQVSNILQGSDNLEKENNQ